MLRAESSTQLRWQTLRAAMLLAWARALVRFLPLSLWRGSLGQVNAASATLESGEICTHCASVSQARSLARRVERAALRLPGTSKCLPKAIALQWMLRRAGLASRLVIAVHRNDRSTSHAFHAWVETGGEMLIGQCDRTQYASVASFDQCG